MAGTVITDTINTSSGIQSTNNALLGCAKAWVNFNGSTSATIRASYNVSSVTYNAAGDYTVTVTTALADINYVPVISTRPANTGYASTQSRIFSSISGGNPANTAPTTTAFRFTTPVQGTTNAADSDYVCVAVFGNG
jgi:hypothetical protein